MARDNPAVPYLHSSLFLAYHKLAQYQRELKQTEQAERTMRRAYELIDRMPTDGPDNLYNLACCRAVCSTSFGSENGKRTAEERAEQKRELDLAMEALSKAVAAGYRDLDHLRKDTDLDALRGREDYKALEADLAARVAAVSSDKLKANQQALVQRQKAAQADPQNKQLQADLAASHHASALIQLELGNVAEAQKHLEQAVKLREALVKDEPKNAQYQTELALSHFAMSDLYWQSGRLVEAVQAWQRNLEVLETEVRAEPKGSSLSVQLLTLRRMVAQHYARAGLWSEAALQYSRLISLEEATDHDYVEAATLALRAGDTAAYRRACGAMAKHWGATEDAFQCGLLVQPCNLAENAGVEPSRLLLWAGKAVEKKLPYMEWPYHELGLAHYRAGHFAEAIAQANKSDKQNPNWPGHINNWPVLAMAHQRLGHTALARQWLDKSTAEWRRLSPLARSVGDTTVVPSSFGLIWFDWPMFEILLREASLLIAGAPPVEDAFNHAHQSLLYSRLGDREKAESEWQEAVKIAPRDPALWLGRARAFAELGRHA
jgi:tetratricopeptide (TPR) repeat protein